MSSALSFRGSTNRNAGEDILKNLYTLHTFWETTGWEIQITSFTNPFSGGPIRTYRYGNYLWDHLWHDGDAYEIIKCDPCFPNCYHNPQPVNPPISTNLPRIYRFKYKCPKFCLNHRVSGGFLLDFHGENPATSGGTRTTTWIDIGSAPAGCARRHWWATPAARGSDCAWRRRGPWSESGRFGAIKEGWKMVVKNIPKLTVSLLW